MFLLIKNVLYFSFCRDPKIKTMLTKFAKVHEDKKAKQEIDERRR